MLNDKCDYFILAYDSPSFSAAAAKVPMSPQGFTKAIHNLERELGVPLFATEGDGTRRPTPYAHEFYEYAKHVQAERNLLQASFERIASSGYVEIRVASALGVPGLLGPDFPGGFAAQHPDVSITLNELPDSLCEAVVRDGLYDLALTITPTGGDFATCELYSSSVLYWVRRDDPLAAKESIDAHDLAGRRIAIPGREFKCCQQLCRRFESEGLGQPAIVEHSEIFWIYEFVLHGGGVGFTLPHLAKLEVFNGSDDVVTVPMEGCAWGFGVSHLKARTMGEREEEFAAYVANCARESTARLRT